MILFDFYYVKDLEQEEGSVIIDETLHYFVGVNNSINFIDEDDNIIVLSKFSNIKILSLEVLNDVLLVKTSRSLMIYLIEPFMIIITILCKLSSQLFTISNSNILKQHGNKNYEISVQGVKQIKVVNNEVFLLCDNEILVLDNENPIVTRKISLINVVYDDFHMDSGIMILWNTEKITVIIGNNAISTRITDFIIRVTIYDEELYVYNTKGLIIYDLKLNLIQTE